MQGPKAPFYVVTALLVVGLIGYGAYRYRSVIAPTGDNSKPQPVNLPKPEADSNQSPTTVKEYKFKPSERLPEVKGISGYKPMVDNTLRFALNVWAGWAPIIYANDGFKAGKIWTTPAGEQFKVELVLIDNPVAMRDAYAAGDIHIGWATVDMLPLFMQGFVDASGNPRDSRVMPRVYQQVDYSNGGDGVVVRDFIKTVADLRGKKIVLAQNSPSHYFILNILVMGGVQPSEVEFVYTEDAFQAAAAFNAQKDLAACVSWAPDIYNLEKVKGNRMLVNTQTANKLIADVWFSRADFAQDHPGIIESLTRGIFDAMLLLKQDSAKQKTAELMAAGYNIPASDTIKMFGDAHPTNWAENYQFFVNQNNPAGFERVWSQAYYLYRRIGAITHQPVAFDKVVDFSVILKLGTEEKYSSQKDEYQVQFTPATPSEIRAEDEILTNTIFIRFFPNSYDLHKKINREIDGKQVEQLYDTNVDTVLKEVATLVGQFGAARIIIEGHADASMKGQTPEGAVKELSQNRARSVMQELINQYKLNANQFAVEGFGWSRPADPADPLNHAKNRRVEIKVFPAERSN